MTSTWILGICAALALTERARAGLPPAVVSESGPVAELVAAFEALPASAPGERIAAQVEALSSVGRGDVRAGRAFLATLRENHPLYQGRGPKEVTHLRGYILASLAEVGPPPESLNLVLAELEYGHAPYLIAAAARAAGTLGTEKAVPYLIRFLGPTFEDDEVSFEKYEPGPTLLEPTTVRLEVLRALKRMGPGSARARDALKSITEGGESSPFLLRRDIQEAAKHALDAIDEDHSGGSDSPLDRDSVQDDDDSWLPPERRNEGRLDAIRALDHNGREISFRELYGRPFVLTFLYTRCDNPNKCSLTMAQLGRLQQAVRTAGLEPHVSLVAVTLDPSFDTPLRLRVFAENRGVVPGERTSLLRVIDEEDFKSLLAELDVPVAFGHGQVSAHGVELVLFDARGRYVRGYEGVLWDNARVLQDLRKLLED